MLHVKPASAQIKDEAGRYKTENFEQMRGTLKAAAEKAEEEALRLSEVQSYPSTASLASLSF